MKQHFESRYPKDPQRHTDRSTQDSRNNKIRGAQ